MWYFTFYLIIFSWVFFATEFPFISVQIQNPYSSLSTVQSLRDIPSPWLFFFFFFFRRNTKNGDFNLTKIDDDVKYHWAFNEINIATPFWSLEAFFTLKVWSSARTGHWFERGCIFSIFINVLKRFFFFPHEITNSYSWNSLVQQFSRRKRKGYLHICYSIGLCYSSGIRPLIQPIYNLTPKQLRHHICPVTGISGRETFLPGLAVLEVKHCCWVSPSLHLLWPFPFLFFNCFSFLGLIWRKQGCEKEKEKESAP